MDPSRVKQEEPLVLSDTDENMPLINREALGGRRRQARQADAAIEELVSYPIQ